MKPSKNKNAFKERIIGTKLGKKSNKDAKKDKFNLSNSNKD